MRRIVFIAVLVAIALGAWRVLQRPASELSSVAQSVPAAAQPPTLPVSSVLQVRPTVSSPTIPSQPTSTSGWAPRASAAVAVFRAGHDYATLWRSLNGATASAEGLYLEAEIYAHCARRAENDPQARDSERARFTASLAGRTVNATQRLAAYERLNADPCAGLDLGTFDAGTLRRMVTAAADAGDARARAWQLAQRVEETRENVTDRRPRGYELAAADFAEARQLLASRDPGVIEDLQGILSSTLQHGSIQLDGMPVDPAAFHSALTLLACEAGASCGPDSPQLLRECAYQGRCAVDTVYEYMYYYGSAPAEAQLIDNYRARLSAMLASGDLSALTRVDVPAPPGYTMVFGGRRYVDVPPTVSPVPAVASPVSPPSPQPDSPQPKSMAS
jgi:hypothetical protein